MRALYATEIGNVSGGEINDGDLTPGRPQNDPDPWQLEVGATGNGSNAAYGSESSGVANPNACSSAATAAGGIGAIAGGAFCAVTGPGALVCAGLGALGGMLYTVGYNPACGPTYVP